jgi:hypothetical protein
MNLMLLMCGWDGNNPGNDGNDISVIPGSYRQNKERGEVTIVRHFTTMMVISSLLICGYARDPG